MPCSVENSAYLIVMFLKDSLSKSCRFLSLAFAPMLSSPFGEGRILIDGRLNQSKSTTKSRPLLDFF